ncbi:MAG: TolB family protein [Planctomycetaceae bacterium]
MTLHRLTTDGRSKRDLVFAPAGDALLFARQETPELISLWRLPLSGGPATRWHPAAATTELEPALSRDGRFAAWVQSRGNLALKLVIEHLPDARQAIFDPGGGFAGMRTPTFAPDGSRVVFSLPCRGGQQLVSLAPDATGRVELTATAGINTHPDFSPDGQQIAFTSTRTGDYEIHILPVAGGDPRRITTSPGMDLRPRWSPDGRQLAFVSHRDGNYEIYLTDAEGHDPVNLTRNPDRDDFPTWHPRERQLAFLSERDGQSDIYLLELD